MTERQDVVAAAKAGGWSQEAGTAAGTDVFHADGHGPEGDEGVLEVVYDEGAVEVAWLNDRLFGDVQTVGLAAHVVAFLSGKAVTRLRDEPNTDAQWDAADHIDQPPKRPTPPARSRSAGRGAA